MTIRRAGVVEAAKLEIDSATIKGSKRVRQLWVLANDQWSERQIWSDAARREWCGIFVLAMLHAEGLGLDVRWEIGSGFAFRLPRTNTPQPGDMFVGPPNLYHHGIVEAHYAVGERQWLASIEGNTPAVVRRDRPEPARLAYYSIQPWLDDAYEAACVTP